MKLLLHDRSGILTNSKGEPTSSGILSVSDSAKIDKLIIFTDKEIRKRGQISKFDQLENLSLEEINEHIP